MKKLNFNALSIGSDLEGITADVVVDGVVVGEAYSSFEATAFAAGSPAKDLLTGIEEAVREALAGCDIDIATIELAAAYGPITSEYGLVNAPYEMTPAGIKELNAGIVYSQIEAIGNLNVAFIPGVRNFIEDVGPDIIGEADYLSGEESKLFGLMQQSTIGGPFTAIFCGRRNRYISVDGYDRIGRCCTTFAGRTAANLLADLAPGRALPEIGSVEIDRGWIRRGSRAFLRAGFNRGLFEGRLMDKLLDGIAPENLINYLVGLVTQADIDSALRLGLIESDAKIYIGGDSPWQEAMQVLLSDELGSKRVLAFSDEHQKKAGPLGALIIAAGNR